MHAARGLKLLLWFITAYQFVCGVLLLLSPALSQLVVTWYGASVTWTDQFSFILKPLGAYMVMTGLIAADAAKATTPRPAIIAALAVLFSISALYRIVRFQFVQATFGIAGWHLVAQIVVLIGLALALTLLSRAAARDTAGDAGTSRA